MKENLKNLTATNSRAKRQYFIQLGFILLACVLIGNFMVTTGIAASQGAQYSDGLDDVYKCEEGAISTDSAYDWVDIDFVYLSINETHYNISIFMENLLLPLRYYEEDAFLQFYVVFDEADLQNENAAVVKVNTSDGFPIVIRNNTGQELLLLDQGRIIGNKIVFSFSQDISVDFTWPHISTFKAFGYVMDNYTSSNILLFDHFNYSNKLAWFKSTYGNEIPGFEMGVFLLAALFTITLIIRKSKCKLVKE